MIAQQPSKNSIFALAITVLGLLSACSSSPVAETRQEAAESMSAPESGPGQRAARIAFEQVGVPYRYGGSAPGGFDCSGLVHYSYARAGLRVPRTTGQLWSGTQPVAQNDLRTGDVLFFNVDGKMSHVGLYLGERQFVHAPSSGRVVSVASLDSPYYGKAFVRAGRPR